MSKVSVIGSGQVGSTCANLLVLRNLADVVLVDVVKGLPQGKALDIMQSASILGFSSRITGTNDFGEIAGSDIVVITAGSARKPGMTRADLLKVNAQVLKSVVNEVVLHAPASIILVVTNPVDVMAYFVYKVSGFDSQRVIGVSGVLDSARFDFFLSEELGIPAVDVDSMVIGAHDDTMIPLINYSKARGEPVSKLLSPGVLDRLIERTKTGGAEIVSCLETGSAFYAPGASAASTAEAVLTDKRNVLPASAYLSGQYGLSDLYIGVPCKIGREGILNVMEIELTGDEEEQLRRSAQAVMESLKALGGLY